jgi:acetoacetyl-CoA synthetase
MPVKFWGDRDHQRYKQAYFDMYPGVWRQGDWVRFSEAGTCVITGRSDATLNRGGVRMGTAELYAVVEEMPEVEDSLVVHLEDDEGGPGELVLFVVADLDAELEGRIRAALRSELSPRHVPDTIAAVPAIPRTLTGKKLEAPVKRILRGAPADQVASRGALAVPQAIDAFVEFVEVRSASEAHQ